jgi:hypothetical protein
MYMGCFFNKPYKEPGNEQNLNNTTIHKPLDIISCIDIKNQYEVSTYESSVSSKIKISITKTHKIEHYHDVIPIIEHYHDVILIIELQMKKKKVENMDKSKENILTVFYKKNNIKQPEIGFKLLTNIVDYEKKIRLQKELINSIFYCEYIKQQEIYNLFRNSNCLLNTHHRNNISRFS